MKPEIIDHPADIGFKVYGETIARALEKSVLAIYYLLIEYTPCEQDVELRFELKGEDLFSITYDILEEVLILFEIEGFIANNVNFSLSECDDGLNLSVCLKGSYYLPGTLVRKYDVKAITYHQMKIEKSGNEWMIQVIVDI